MASTKFRTARLELPAASVDGRSSIEGEVEFLTDVIDAGATIQSWNLRYPEDGTRRFHEAGVEITNIETEGRLVKFLVTGILRSRYTENAGALNKGLVTVLVVAECN